jgi:hypothetical protein
MIEPSGAMTVSTPTGTTMYPIQELLERFGATRMIHVLY